MTEDMTKDLKTDVKTIEFYGKLAQEEIDKIESDKAAFGRRMKMPDKGELKEGCPYGSIRYGAFDKFKPAGGGEK